MSGRLLRVEVTTCTRSPTWTIDNERWNQKRREPRESAQSVPTSTEKTPDLRITTVSAACFMPVLYAERLGVEGASSYARPKRNSYPCPFPHCGSRKYSRLADHLTTAHHLTGAGWQRLRRLLLDISHRMEDDDLLDKERTLLSRLPIKVEDYMQPAVSSKVVSKFSSRNLLLYDFPARCSRRLCNSLLEV